MLAMEFDLQAIEPSCTASSMQSVLMMHAR